MKATQTKPVRLVNEPGDSEMKKNLAKHFNGLMDALAWFYGEGVQIRIQPAKNGWTIEFIDPSQKVAPDISKLNPEQ